MHVESQKEPLEIVIKNAPEKTVAFACGACGVLFTPRAFACKEDVALLATKELAAGHCGPKPCDCGKVIERQHYTKCNACCAEKEEQKEKALFDKAKKVALEDYPDVPVYWPDGPTGSMGDGYYSNVEELLEICEEDAVDLPDHIWGTSPVPFRIDADHIVEGALSEHYEDAYDSLGDGALKELQTVLDEWCGKQKIKSWEPDYGTAVLLRPIE